MYKAKEITLPVDFQRSKNACKDGFQTKRPEEQPLIVHKYAITELVLGKPGEGNSTISGPTLPFYPLSQTKQP